MRFFALLLFFCFVQCSGGGSTDRKIPNDDSGSSGNTDDPANNTTISIIQDAFIKSSNNSDNDEFATAVSAGNDFVVIGTEKENAQAGAAYVITQNTNGDWEETQQLLAHNASPNDRFGKSVAVSGDFIVVGARNQNGGEGAAYVFIRDSGGSWNQEAYLKPSSLSNMAFGTSVSIDGETIVIGAIGESSNSTSIINTDDTADTDTSSAFSGAAYVFKRDGAGDWYQDAYLKPSNSDAVDQFGTAVAISSDTIVVSAISEASSSTEIDNNPDSASSLNDQGNSGAVYVFTLPGSDWIQSAYIKPSEHEGGDSFGKVIAIDDGLIAVATDDDSSSRTILNDDSASPSDNDAIGSGAVYLFSQDNSDNWYQDAYLKTSNLDGGDGFGASIDILNGNILIGTKNESSNATGITLDDGTANEDNGSLNSGAAFIFSKIAGDWVQDIYIKASGPGESDNFGTAVALSDGFIIIGAPKEDSNLTEIINTDGEDDGDNNGTENGAGYIFEIE